MKHLVVACALSLAFVRILYAQPAQTLAPSNSCAQSLLNIDGNQIWVDKEGEGNVTVVFEAGFGNDSTAWSSIAPKIRGTGIRTFVYDRAGMGKSTINTATPYSLDNDVHLLRTALNMCGIKGSVVMVGHSYGGAISLMTAAEDDRIKGLVLVDAVVPGVWPKTEVDKNLVMMRSQYDEVRAKAPALAKVAIPWAEAMPVTAKQIDAIHVPEAMPIIDIVAEKGQNDPNSAKIWRKAHTKFLANNPHREYVLAVGSSHKVMADQPDLVVKEIQKMLQSIPSRATPVSAP